MARAADGELAAEAAIGDTGAYANLYHRHIVAAWRLAQATAPSPEAATKATTKAFVRMVRLVGRGRDDVAQEFRHHLLAAVYREARSGSDGDRAPAKRATAGGAQMVTAFAHLPTRWRAALWLQEVEQLPAVVVGPILGVSSAAAVQLNKRAIAGLEHRVLQAGGSLPMPDIAGTLSSAAPPLPGVVQAKTESKWKRAVASDRNRGGPEAGWIRQRAPRPLALCAAGLCAAGLVGLAVVNPQHTISQVAAPPPTTVAPAAAAVGPAVTPTTAAPTAQGREAAQGPQLVAVQPAPAVVTTVATLPPITVAQAPVTVPTVLTVPTLPPLTTPPTTTPITNPPVTPPVLTPTPAAQTTPLVQVSLNAGVLAVNVGLGPNACTGVNLLGIKIGCTTSPPGLSLGGTLLGGL